MSFSDLGALKEVLEQPLLKGYNKSSLSVSLSLSHVYVNKMVHMFFGIYLRQ